MKGKVSALLLAGLLLAGALEATAADLQSPAGLQRWMTYYYLKPDPDRFVEAVRSMAGSGLLDNEAAMPPVFGFVAGVVRDNPGRLQDWTKAFESLADGQLSTIALGIWYAQLPESQTIVRSLIEQRAGVRERLGFLRKGATAPITEIPLEQGPWVLDANWGNFMASGARAPVLRIISALPWLEVSGDADKLLIGGAAEWSLVSNAVHHAKVLEICESEIPKQPKQVADKLREVVASARKELSGGPK